MQHQNLVNVITDALPGLNKSERKVAEAILSDPESALGQASQVWLKEQMSVSLA